MTSDRHSYTFGPVPSRRLGRSLGVDIIPFKVCSLDCIYCQLGRTTEKSFERRDFVPVDDVLAEISKKLQAGVQADFITISGSGEPTLNIRMGEIIGRIKKITDIPVAILTNGTLLWRPDVRADCAKADVVVPSLDAGNEEIFQRINKPAAGISFEKLMEGLCQFRQEYPGQIWLEVFMVQNVNTSAQALEDIRTAIRRVNPDKIQLNTAVRPTAESNVERVSAEQMEQIACFLGEKCEVVAAFQVEQRGKNVRRKVEDVLEMLQRRPCSLDDICAGLGIHRNEALKYLGNLQQRQLIERQDRNGVIFFAAKRQ